MKSLSAQLFTIALTSVFILSCVDEGAEGPTDAHVTEAGNISIQLGTPPPEITSVIAKLTRSGYSPREIELAISDTGQSASGSFADVPVGIWHLRIDARDNQGTTRYSGETDVEVRSDQIANITLHLLPTGGGIEIIVTWGPPPFPTAGLMAHLPMNGNAVDISGNGNNGSVTGAVPVSDRNGNPNSAMWFDGVNDVISIPSSVSLHPTTQLTIAFWIRVDSVTGMYCPILHKGGEATPHDLHNREYAVYIMGPHPGYHFEVYAAAHWSGSDFYPVGQWLFVVGVINKTNHTIRTYINGNLEQTVNDPNNSFFANEYSLLIGNERETIWPDHAPFRGRIDELRLFNRALTQAEVLALYNN